MKKTEEHSYTAKDATAASQGAEQLLSFIKRYRATYNVTNQQYAYLMKISRKQTIFYLNELIEKGYIKVEPENRRAGRGRANKYFILKEA
ncbi:hypothetical protein J7643_11000 [bacterium]|nr:hypothetical protein [bacterium]